MARMALAIYLVFAAAAGPWLCCCGSSRLAAALAPQRDNHSEPSSPPPCHCCHDAPPSEESAPQIPHDRHPCPCQEDGTTALLALPSSSETADILARLAWLIEAASSVLGPSGDLQTEEVSPILPGAHSPFLTAQDLLRAFHIMRC